MRVAPGIVQCCLCSVLVANFAPQFKDWFSNPLTGAVETGQEVSKQLVERLHGVLRPFLLRYTQQGLQQCSVQRMTAPYSRFEEPDGGGC